MRKDDLIRLRHMLDAAREANAFCQHKTRSSLDTDRKLVPALVKCLRLLEKQQPRYRTSPAKNYLKYHG